MLLPNPWPLNPLRSPSASPRAPPPPTRPWRRSWRRWGVLAHARLAIIALCIIGVLAVRSTRNKVTKEVSGQNAGGPVTRACVVECTRGDKPALNMCGQPRRCGSERQSRRRVLIIVVLEPCSTEFILEFKLPCWLPPPPLGVPHLRPHLRWDCRARLRPRACAPRGALSATEGSLSGAPWGWPGGPRCRAALSAPEGSSAVALGGARGCRGVSLAAPVAVPHEEH